MVAARLVAFKVKEAAAPMILVGFEMISLSARAVVLGHHGYHHRLVRS
jgi:hypothetical protein